MKKFEDQLKALLPYLYAGLGYLVIAIIVTWPLIEVMNEKVIRYPNDISPDIEGTFWYHWWVKHALLNGQNINFCDMIYSPIGRNVLLLFKNNLDCFFAFPFLCIFGFPGYYNILCIVVMIGNGLAVYALARRFTQNHMLAFLTGFLVSFNHFTINELQCGRIIQAILATPALYVLFFLKLLEEDRRRNILYLALILLINALLYWFYGMFLAIFTAVFILFYALFYRNRFGRPQIIRLLLSYGLFAILVIPFITPFFTQMKTEGGMPQTPFFQDYPSMSEMMQTDEDTDPRKFAFQLSARVESEPFFYPIVLIAIGVFLSFFRMKECGYHWILTMLFLFSLAMGPYLFFHGTHYDIKLPYYFFYKYVPLYSRLFWPLRIMSVVLIITGVLFTMNLDWIFRKIESNSHKIISGTVVILLIFFTLYETFQMKGILPFEMSAVKIPRIFRSLAAEKGDIIELPFLYCSKSVVNQMVHNKKVLGGPGITATWDHPQEFTNFWKSNSFLAYLNELNDLDIPFPTFAPEDLELVKKMGFRFLVLYPEYCKQANFHILREDTEELRQALSTRLQNAMEAHFGKPVYKSDEVIIYEMDGHQTGRE